MPLRQDFTSWTKCAKKAAQRSGGVILSSGARQGHLGSAFRAQRCRATTHLATGHRPLCRHISLLTRVKEQMRAC